MRWLITGGAGQLGTHLRSALTGEDAVVPTSRELDVTEAAAVDSAIGRHRPDVVINAAAYTAVDAAETDEDRAFAVNAGGPSRLAAALARHGGRLIHVSTDYVFAGDATEPYETDAPTGPRTAYGRTKLAGEQAVRELLPDASWVVRTAWVYGGPSANFVDTMRRLESERDTVDVVADQTGSPTNAADLAAALVTLGRAAPPAGVLHYVNTGQATWYDLAREVFSALGADPDRVRPVTTADFPRPAPRPAWSVLSTRAWTDAGLPAPRDWRTALHDHLGR